MFISYIKCMIIPEKIHFILTIPTEHNHHYSGNYNVLNQRGTMTVQSRLMNRSNKLWCIECQKHPFCLCLDKGVVLRDNTESLYLVRLSMCFISMFKSYMVMDSRIKEYNYFLLVWFSCRKTPLAVYNISRSSNYILSIKSLCTIFYNLEVIRSMQKEQYGKACSISM